MVQSERPSFSHLLLVDPFNNDLCDPFPFVVKLDTGVLNQVISVHMLSSILFHKEQKYVLVKCININNNEQNKDKAMDLKL